MTRMPLLPGWEEAGSGHPTLAILVGLACWGAEAAAERVRGWATRADPAPAAEPATVAPRGLTARGLLVGLIITAPPHAANALRRFRAASRPAVRLALGCARPILRLPGVHAALAAGERLRARGTAALEQVAGAGEREAARCQRMVQLGAREMFEEVVGAVGQAAAIREVLVEQSAGLAEQTLIEVRRSAERADAAVESTARSILPRWLRSRRGGGDEGDRSAPVASPWAPAPRRT